MHDIIVNAKILSRRFEPTVAEGRLLSVHNYTTKPPWLPSTFLQSCSVYILNNVYLYLNYVNSLTNKCRPEEMRLGCFSICYTSHLIFRQTLGKPFQQSAEQTQDSTVRDQS